MKRIVAVVMSVVLLIGIGRVYANREPYQDSWDLYFLEKDLTAVSGADALRPEMTAGDPTASTPHAAELLMERLLQGPTDPALKSIIPAGTVLQSLEIEQGIVQVDLSSPYRNLSGVNLSLADYSIVLTLTQLREITTVRITVMGRELVYRDRQQLLPDDVLLSSKEDVISTVSVTLYFPDAEGNLAAEERVLSLYEGDTQAGAVIRALESGATAEGFLPVFRDDFRVRGVWMEEDICFVNLSAAMLAELSEQEIAVMTGAIEMSLCSLRGVDEARFLADGEYTQLPPPKLKISEVPVMPEQA